MSHYYVHDIRHVADKFGLSTESPLAQRLGKANTKRRQLLAYNRDHSERIAKYVDIASERAADRGSKSTSSAPKDATSSQWTQDTTASTIRPIDFEAPSDAGRTRFSSTSSTGDDHKILTIPLPPEYESASQNVPFMCPYCYQLIQLENFDDDWEYHVYSDLRPYICTFGNCAQESQLYDSYTEWSEHEWLFHRCEWACHICPNIFSSGGDFRAHLRDDHAGSIAENQLDMIIQLSGRPATSPQQCSLCNKAPVGDLGRFQKHLARHLRQLSLFVLPNSEYEDTDEGSETDCERSLDDIDSRNAILSNSGSRRSVNSWEYDEETHEVTLEAHNASGLAAAPTQGAAGDSGEESKSSAPGLRRDYARVIPRRSQQLHLGESGHPIQYAQPPKFEYQSFESHYQTFDPHSLRVSNDPGAGYNIERLADEVAQLEVNTESNKSHTAIDYTGFTLFMSELPDQKATWANAERTPMKMSHAQLEDLVQKRAKEVSAANQYESLSPEQRTAVDELIKELQSDFGICTFAYVKVYQNIDPQDDYFNTPCMEVILSRQLEKRLHDDQAGPSQAGSHPVSQVPRPPPDAKSPEGTYKKQHNMSGFGGTYLYICVCLGDKPKPESRPCIRNMH